MRVMRVMRSVSRIEESRHGRAYIFGYEPRTTQEAEMDATLLTLLVAALVASFIYLVEILG